MLINNYKSFLGESVEDLIDQAQDRDVSGDFDIEDIYNILDDLSQPELNQLGEFIMELIYDPEFDLDDLGEEEDGKEDEEEETIDEVRYFKTRKRQLNRAKKKNISQRKRDKKLRKRYYRKNKAKMKRKNKLYRKKVKRQPNRVKRHRN